MDHVLHGFRDRLRKVIESGLPPLPAWARKSRIPRGAWLFPLALMLGVWANRGSREEGRIAWLRANAPHPETWRSVLTRRGFGLLDDPSWREKAFAEMPDAGRTQGSAWVAEDRTVVAIRTEGDWLYFGLARKGNGGQPVQRAQWEPLGLGWEAVAQFDRLDLPEFRTRPEKMRVPTEWQDPRRLNY